MHAQIVSPCMSLYTSGRRLSHSTPPTQGKLSILDCKNQPLPPPNFTSSDEQLAALLSHYVSVVVGEAPTNSTWNNESNQLAWPLAPADIELGISSELGVEQLSDEQNRTLQQYMVSWDSDEDGNLTQQEFGANLELVAADRQRNPSILNPKP
jgi:hypothetical protein